MPILITGPGKAWSAKEQGEYLFKLAGKKPWLIGVPVGLMDGIISIFDTLTKVFPNLEVRSSAQSPISFGIMITNLV